MNALSRMNDYDPLGEIPRYTAPVSAFKRSVEETQSISVVPSGCRWQEVLARMTCEDASMISSSAYIAQEEVERIEDIQKREGVIKWLENWNGVGDEEEQRDTLAFLMQALHEDGFC